MNNEKEQLDTSALHDGKLASLLAYAEKVIKKNIEYEERNNEKNI